MDDEFTAREIYRKHWADLSERVPLRKTSVGGYGTLNCVSSITGCRAVPRRPLLVRAMAGPGMTPGADPASPLTMKPLQGVSFERDVSFRNIGISAPNNFHCLRARHDRGAPAVPLAKELAERDSFASRDSCVFLALSA